uniref:Serum amyloid A protein n=1 Tax=Chelonoidis abingdonii TaxID=106734 RepID=A0A8C0HK08_CHEAB
MNIMAGVLKILNVGEITSKFCFKFADMWRAYSDMREANYKNADKYFHARGNYDAAQRGPGGKWAAEVISGGRQRPPSDRRRWGRIGGGDQPLQDHRGPSST